ncbi:MAG TPA: hypothetical protein PK156_03770 [Polyangium sp.]|nr:hypothetical protein [Polyangium sp.]
MGRPTLPIGRVCAVHPTSAVEAARILASIWSRTLGPDGVAAEAVGICFEDAAATFFEA